MKIGVFSALILITLGGFFLRANNLSPFKFYPDSYQNLIVAKNIQDYGNVTGTLGKEGMDYPPYFMWSRPIYPMLINSYDIFNRDLTDSAYQVALLLGILTIPLVFFLIKTTFNSDLAGLASSTLTALSFNHTVWSGYIMSETTGVFLSTAFFYLLFRTLYKKSQILEIKDILTGITFSLAVFARYEYIFLIIPSAFLVLLTSPKPFIKMFNVLFSFILTSLVIFSFLFPIVDTFRIIYSQNKDLMMAGLLSLFAFIIIFYIFTKVKITFLFNRLTTTSQLFFFIFVGLFIIIASSDFNLPYLIGLSNFVRTDFLLGIFAAFGIGLLIKEKKYLLIAIFCLLSFLIMEAVYLRVNPLMQRYTTHLIPILLIPAAYAPLWLVRKITNIKPFFKLSFYLGLFVITALQIVKSNQGFKNWHERAWIKTSYEEAAARQISKKITKNELIIASLPEPYYYFTNHSTRSLTPNYPYLFIDDLDPEKELVIVNDMPMRTIFPEFSLFVSTNLKDYEIDSFWINSNFLYKTDKFNETHPVSLYKIKTSELLSKLTDN